MQTWPRLLGNISRKANLLVLSVLSSILLIGCGSQTDTDETANQGASPDSLCGMAATPISAIQGMGDASTLVAQTHRVEAIIISLAPALNGLFVQEQENDFDDSELSSEGLFVATTQSLGELSTGQVISVAGIVEEVEGKTQLVANTEFSVCGSAVAKAVPIALPLNNGSLESLEHMLVSFKQELQVINTFNLSSFGQIDLATEKLFNPSHVHKPGSEQAKQLAARNAQLSITLDDFSESSPQQLDLYGELNAKQPLRIGSVLQAVSGVIDQTSLRYRLRFIEAAETVHAPRPSAPTLSGDIVIAAFNVLNLFNGDGQKGDFPTSRGANSFDEFSRQKSKIVNAILALNPDIIGLNEIENDAENTQLSSIYQLATALNTQLGKDVYDYIAYTSDINGASIANGMLYRSDKVTVQGQSKVLTSENSPRDAKGPLFFTEKSRPALTQAFSVKGSENTFVVSVNHLKSKGSSCGEGDDSREQGNCNLTRTRAAQGLAKWLQAQYDGLPIFIIGDLNSYPQEDPIQALKTAGFTDVMRDKFGSDSYTYSFRGQLGALDYVMANAPANELIASAFEWHINAAEPRVLDYSVTLPRSDIQKPTAWLSNNPYRSSDHDPVVIGISFP